MRCRENGGRGENERNAKGGAYESKREVERERDKGRGETGTVRKGLGTVGTLQSLYPY